MAMTERSTIVGVFTEPGLADRAIEELERAGFRDDHLSLFSHLTGSDRKIIKKLESMGVPEEEAGYYQGELDLGRTIVTVEAGDRQEDALEILRANGAYDATTRRGA